MRKLFVLLVAAFMIAGTTQAAEAKSFSISIKASTDTVKLGSTFTLQGKVSPKAAKQKVKIQRRYEGGSWKTIKTVKLSKKSSFSYKVKPTRGGPTAYRVQKPSSHGRSAKTSSTKVVNVFRWRPLQSFPVSTPYTLIYGTRSITGQKFPASVAFRGSDVTWTIGAGRCTTFKTSIGVDETSAAGVTASPNMFWNNGLPGETMFQNNSQNADLSRLQNPRSFSVPIPAGISTYKLFPLLVGATGPNDFLTLGTPQLYCNS